MASVLSPVPAASQMAAVEAVCTDMNRPYLNVVAEVLPHAEAVFDTFHVLQHASAALDDARRHEFFREGAVMRAHGRGKRWLLLRRWVTVRGSKRELEALFAANRRLFKANGLREQLDRLGTRRGVMAFLLGWIKPLRWQRLPERVGSVSFSSAISRGPRRTPIIRSGSASLNRSTPPSKRPFAAPVGCAMTRCSC